MSCQLNLKNAGRQLRSNARGKIPKFLFNQFACKTRVDLGSEY